MGASIGLASLGRLVWRLALPVLPWLEKPRMPDTAAGPATPTRDDCTASALPMTGQRWPSSWSFEMVPPHGEAWGRVEVDRARRVEGDVFFKKGHMALDCRRTASIVADGKRRSTR